MGCPTITPPNDYCYGPAVAVGTVDAAPPSSPVVKGITQPSAAIGEIFTYTITVPETPYSFPAYDVRIYDDLTDSQADLRFVDRHPLPWTTVREVARDRGSGWRHRHSGR